MEGGRSSDASQRKPLTTDNLLLRGCTLRKTDWAVSEGGEGVNKG